jgi:hypothetical protein
MTDPTATPPNPILADFRVSFAPHREHGPVDDYVLQGHGILGELPDLTTESLVDALPEILRVACVKAAARKVDYDKLGDSEYLDLCDKLGLEYKVTAIAFEGRGEAVRYKCNGSYPAGGGWTDNVMAVDDEDAVFQAKWAMAANRSVPTTDYDGFAASMDECDIDFWAPEPVTLDEITGAAKDMIAEVGSSSGPAYDKVVEMLGKLGIDLVAGTTLRM